MHRNPDIASPSLSHKNGGSGGGVREAMSVTGEVRTARTGSEHASAALDDGWNSEAN